jgi:hypothetical protein
MFKNIPQKFRYLFFSLLTIFLYSVAVTFAAYPTTPFSSSDQMLDPPCIPGGTNCYVSSGGGFTGTEGSIPFADSAGSLTEDNTNLFWDDTNNRLGILDATPSSALTIGSGDLFQVNSSGDIVKINNVTYSWPSSQSSSNHKIINDGSGNLSWGLISGSSIIRLYSENPSSPTTNTVSGTNTIAIGSGHTVSNTGAIALGSTHTVSSTTSGGAWGYGNTTSSSHSLVAGVGNASTTSFGEHKFGTYAVSASGGSATASSGNNRLFIIGNGTSSGSRSKVLSVHHSAGAVLVVGSATPVIFSTGFYVGSSLTQFVVTLAGNISRINSITMSWPSSQGSANTFLRNNGSGTLTWVDSSSLTGTSKSIQYNNSGVFGTSSMYFESTTGYISVGDATPADNLFTVSTNAFAVNSSGNLVRVNGVTYDWPSSQGALNTILKNNGSGALSWYSFTLPTPAGSNDQIQLNSSNVLGVTSNQALSWDGTRLIIGNNNTLSIINTSLGYVPSDTVMLGYQAGKQGISVYSTFLGPLAGYGENTNSVWGYNTLIGYKAGYEFANGAYNFTIVGSGSIQDVGDSVGLVALGDNISIDNSSQPNASRNVLIGSGAGGTNFGTTIVDNIAIGYAVGSNIGSGLKESVGIGYASFNSYTPTDGNMITIGVFSSTVDHGISLGYGANDFSSISNASLIVIGSRGLTGPTTTDIIFGSPTTYNTLNYGIPFLQSAPAIGTNIAGIDFSLSGGKATGSAVGGSLKFYTSDAGASGTTMQSITEKMRIEADGGIFMYNLATSTGGAGYDAVCLNASTEELTINTNGDDCVVSSARFKTDITALDLGLDFINKLSPKSFTYKNDGSKRIGFIAEEIAPLDPRLVFYETDGTTVRGVNYQDMTAVLAKAIQELDVRVLRVETQITKKSLNEILLSEVREFLSSMTNELQLVVANRQIARNKICIDDFCMTKEQLKIIIENDANSN